MARVFKTPVTVEGEISTNNVISSTLSSGDEGGQINLAKAATNTTLTTGVTIDVYQNKLRFWESGGTNRGYYIDITGGASSAGTSLTGGSTGAMNYAQTVGTKQSAIFSAGTTIVSVSITTNGYPTQVTVTGDMENNSAGGWVILQLYRDSTAIGNPVHAESSAGSENVPYALSVVDAPAAGTYTYALKINNSAGGTFNFGESNGPVITAVELSGPKGDTGATGAAGTSPNAFTTIAVPSGTNPVAATSSDTLTFTAGTGISITGTASTDTIAIATNATASNTVSTIVTRDASGNFAAGTITAATFSGSGASLTNVPAANVTGTLTSTVLGNSTVYIGTTAVALNRTTADLALTGITSITGGTGTTAIALNTAAVTGAASGAINAITGATTTSGTTGAVTVRSGNSAAASGATTVSTGTSTGTTSGILTLSTGAVASGTGNSGALAISTGAAGTSGNSGAITMDVGTKTSGTFGTITIGGTNASAITVGNATNTATANLVSSTSINLNSPAINSNAATLALLATPTTITAGAAATAVTVGASTGTLTLNNPTIATSVTSGTLALFNTGLTGTLSIGGAAGTINIGDSTTTKAINIGTSTTTGNSSTVRIGTAQASTTSDILLQGQIYAGKSVSGTGNQTGYNAAIYGSAVTATGTTGNATAGNLTILAPDAVLSNGSNITGNATSGSLILDAGNSQFNAGSPIYGTVSIGTSYASLITLGKSGTAVKIPTGTVPTSSLQQFGMIAGDAESVQLATTKTTGAGPGFGLIRAPQMVFALADAPASASSTTGVAAFAAANDVLSSLEVNKLYQFKGKYYVTYTAGGAAAALQMLFAFANAPQAIKYNFRTTKSTSATTMDQVGIGAVTTGVSVSTSTQTSGTFTVEFDGYFTSNATTGGTLTPQIAASGSTSGGTFVVTTGSWFEIQKIGTATQTLIAGNWA